MYFGRASEAWTSSLVFSKMLSTMARWMSQPTMSIVASGVIARPVYGPTRRSTSVDAVLLRELRHFVQELEADAVAREARGVEGPDHDPAEPFRRVHLDEVDERRVGLPACDELSPDDDVRGLKKCKPRKFLRNESVLPAASALIERPLDTLATIESGLRTLSTRAKNCRLMSKSSVTASKMRSALDTAASKSAS